MVLSRGASVAAAALLQCRRFLADTASRGSGAARAAWLQSRSREQWRSRRRVRAPLIVRWADAEIAELSALLELSLQLGALESSAPIAQRLYAERDKLPVRERGRALTAILETFVLRGDLEGARELASSHRGELASHTSGARCLEALGLGDGHFWFNDGRPNCSELSRRLAARTFNLDDLLDELTRRPWVKLRWPELYLVMFSASWPEARARACAFLDRFLSFQSATRCEARPFEATSGNVLRELSFFDRGRVKTGPLVSVLVSAYNSRQTVIYAVDSLLQQTYQNLEILICDDASTDDTLQVLVERYVGKPRVRMFRSMRNQGAYNVKNALATRARGAFLTCHDADDLALPTRIATQVSAFNRPGVVASVTNGLRIRPNGQVVFFKDGRAERLSLVSSMLSRRALDAVGPFTSARIGADWERHEDVCSRFGLQAVAHTRKALIFSLWSPASMTRQSGSESLESGYRSPSRRAYCELVFAKHHLPEPPTTRAINDRLRETGNYAEPCEIVEV
jgi:hypothetical protein